MLKGPLAYKVPEAGLGQPASAEARPEAVLSREWGARYTGGGPVWFLLFNIDFTGEKMRLRS